MLTIHLEAVDSRLLIQIVLFIQNNPSRNLCRKKKLMCWLFISCCFMVYKTKVCLKFFIFLSEKILVLLAQNVSHKKYCFGRFRFSCKGFLNKFVFGIKKKLDILQKKLVVFRESLFFLSNISDKQEERITGKYYCLACLFNNVFFAVKSKFCLSMTIFL